MSFTVGQKLYITPIRFWETAEPETAILVEPDNGSTHLMVFHDGYGHNVYVQKDKTFATPEEVAKDIEIKLAAREAEIETEVNEIIERIMSRFKNKP
jgi:hypothetical protein